MRILSLSFMIIMGVQSHAQETVKSTDQFMVEGLVKTPMKFALPDALLYKSISLDSFIIYNHLGERKRSMTNIRGVLLRDILDKSGIDAPSHKVLSEFYVVCIASDNYKVVFSWNELYNTDIGNHVLVITEADGKKAPETSDRITILSSSDQATGRRYLKGLQKIVVSRVQ